MKIVGLGPPGVLVRGYKNVDAANRIVTII